MSWPWCWRVCADHGGPLLTGDIEDIEGHSCIICPWHRYIIELSTGDGFYYGINIEDKSRTLKRKAPDQRQRVHHVRVVDRSVLCDG